MDLFQIDVLSTSVSRTPATYDCCPGLVYPRVDWNFKFKYNTRMEGNELVTPDSENEVEDD